jgi:hypothetical protein
MRAVAHATAIFIANVGNLVIAPQMVGFLSDWFAFFSGPNAASLRLALLCLAPSEFWAAARFYTAAARIINDQERATGVNIESAPERALGEA